MSGHAGEVLKRLFKGTKIPTALTSQDLYSGPQAFGSYRPESASAGEETRGFFKSLGATGWNATDTAAQGQAQRQVARNESSQRGAVLNNAAARGQLNGGNSFLAGLQAQQSGADRNMESATALGIAGADRRMQAMQGIGDIDMARAGATDQFNQWATGMQQNATQGAYDSRMQRYAAKDKQKWYNRITGALGGG